MTQELEFRRPADEDAQAVADLANAFDAVLHEEADTLSRADVLEWWRREGEGRLVLDGESLVGFAFLQRRNNRYDGDGYVHPQAFGRGVGTAILDWVESRAGELCSPEVRTAVFGDDERAACLLRGRGFRPIRTRRLEHDLCFLVRAGDDLTAAAECKREQFGMGWVGTLGTRREYRRHGLGEALLRHAFRELFACGVRRVGLGVDAENTTGATRLYERAGMHVAFRADVYAKVLQVR